MSVVFTFDEALILLIEDNPGHARLIEKNLNRAGIFNEVVVAHDGQEAMDILFGEKGGSIVKEPLLVILDLNLPIYNGISILEKIRKEPETRHIPVVIVTTTDDGAEVNRCYELGCNAFIKKPIDYEDFSAAMRQLGNLFSIIAIPREKHAQS